MSVRKSIVHNVNTYAVSHVYTLDMPKFVYVQVSGIEKPAKIKADEVVKSGQGNDEMLTLRLAGKEIGEFKSIAVNGWWIEDEPEKKGDPAGN